MCIRDRLKSLGAKVIAIGVEPNGMNINKNCGSVYPQNIKRAVKKYKAHIGISLDGDADRVIMCDEKSNIIDGDQIIAALASSWRKLARLSSKRQDIASVLFLLLSNCSVVLIFA